MALMLERIILFLMRLGETVFELFADNLKVSCCFFCVFKKIAYFCITIQLNVLKGDGYETDRRTIY